MKYKILQIIPTEPGWIVIHGDAEESYWEPVFTMALVECSYKDDGEEYVFQAVEPLIPSLFIGGLSVPGQQVTFGTESAGDEGLNYEILHWSKVAEHIRRIRRIDDRDGLMEYLGAFTGKEKNDALMAIAKELRMLGFGDAYSEGWGAIEGHTVKMKEAYEQIAYGLDGVASAIDRIAESIDGGKR